MGRAIFILCSLFGLGVALPISWALGRSRLSSIPLSACWSSILFGGVVCIYGLAHSTTPSFAPRITAVGGASVFTEKNADGDRKFAFELFPEAGDPVELETHIS